MTHDPGGPPPQVPATPQPPEPPLSPKPGNLAIAFALVLLLFFNIYLDSQPGSYDGKYLTFGVIALIAAVLGVDVSRFWRGKDGP
jgi:hypothetical protein